jgi:hypothetical protein
MEGKLTKGSWWPEVQRKMVVNDGRVAEAGPRATDGLRGSGRP